MDEFADILQAIDEDKLEDLTEEQLSEAQTQIKAYGKELRQTKATGEDLEKLISDAEALASALEKIDGELERRETEAADAEEKKEKAFAAFDGPGDGDESDDEDAEEDAEASEEKVPVTAAAVVRTRGEIRKPAAAEPVEDKPKALVAAAVGGEDKLGAVYDSQVDALSALWTASHRGLQGESAVLRIPIDTGTYLDGDRMDTFAKLRKLKEGVAQARSEMKPLVAAGFCAPVEPTYDYFQASSAAAGIIDLPEANARRGRISIPGEIGPVNLAGTAGIGTNYTAAQDQAGTEKNCFTVVCGDDDVFPVSATYTCLRFSNFDDVFYPERVAHVSAEALVVAAHNTNSRLIADIVTSPRTQFVNELEDLGGAWVNIVRSVSRVSHWYRERHKLPEDLTLELILPYWVRASLQADNTARQSTQAPDLVVSAAEVSAELGDLNVNVQFVYDWQDQDQPGAFDGFASYLLFSPGSVVRLRGATLDMGVVRDSTLNVANDFQIFVETFDGIATPGYQVAYVSGLAVCPTGGVGLAAAITCAGS